MAVIISRMCPAPARVAALNNRNVLLQTTSPSPLQFPPLAPHMYCQPWLGGQALTSVGPSRNAVLWARAEEQENGAPAVSSSPKLTQFRFPPPSTSRRLSLDFCQKGSGNNIGLYTCVAKGYLSRFLVEKVSCFFFFWRGFTPWMLRVPSPV